MTVIDLRSEDFKELWSTAEKAAANVPALLPDLAPAEINAITYDAMLFCSPAMRPADRAAAEKARASAGRKLQKAAKPHGTEAVNAVADFLWAAGMAVEMSAASDAAQLVEHNAKVAAAKEAAERLPEEAAP